MSEDVRFRGSMKVYLLLLPEQLRVCLCLLPPIYTHQQAMEEGLMFQQSCDEWYYELTTMDKEEEFSEIINLLDVKLGIFSQGKEKLAADSFIDQEKASSILDRICEVQFPFNLQVSGAFSGKREQM